MIGDFLGGNTNIIIVLATAAKKHHKDGKVPDCAKYFEKIKDNKKAGERKRIIFLFFEINIGNKITER